MDADFPILAIGDLTSPEFADAAESLAGRGVMHVPDATVALAKINEGFAPAVFIVAQRWPGECAASQVDALRRAVPLARFVSLLGSWLEGETRTGRPLAGSLRIYWHRWTEFSPVLDKRSTKSHSAWSLPSTSSDDERLLSAHDFQPSGSSLSATPCLLIAIVARDRETFRSLADLCARRGWQTVWPRNVEQETSLHPDAVLVDAATTSEIEFSRLARLQAAIRPPPIIAILGFPRFEDASRWKAAGATAVISKPFQSHILLHQIERLAKPA